MKNLFLLLVALVTFSSCKDNTPAPSLSGTFVGPVSVRSEKNHGTSTYSEGEITLKQLSTTSVEISSRQFDAFVIHNVKQYGAMYSAGEGTNTFSYSQNEKSKSLLLDWTTEVNGNEQTVVFGGGKKK
ncbi:hypothetical protein [Telluribacter sp. SYSU D00476]|uniref:hypothetical protein n=1 Tax=Telluribacter sp. SYSU D00476 TaxID=2811430 RepID=UPI001FF17FA9|nr:hypothetical protein [Telluribacter sp. SYSU D00476]